MQQYLQKKKGLVQNVFDQVYDQYDLMNDIMSMGVHRIWKKNFASNRIFSGISGILTRPFVKAEKYRPVPPTIIGLEQLDSIFLTSPSQCPTEYSTSAGICP